LWCISSALHKSTRPADHINKRLRAYYTISGAEPPIRIEPLELSHNDSHRSTSPHHLDDRSLLGLMSRSPPLRNRLSSSLLSLGTPVTGSRSPLSSPTLPSPISATFESVASRRTNSLPPSSLLPAPVTYGGNEKRAFQPLRSPTSMTPYPYWRLKRLLLRPLLWIFVLLVTLVIWWTNGGRQDVRSPEMQATLRELFPPEITRDLQFFPAANHKIHVGAKTSH